MSETLFRTIQNQSDIERRTAVLESAEFAIMQVGTAAPAHNAAESVLYMDTVNDDLYINADGLNNWQLIAGGGGIVAAHNLMSVSHSDTVAGAPVRGDVVVANATPAWAAFAIGTAHQLFKVNAGGTDPEWDSFDWDEIASAAAADMVHNHTNNTEGGTLTTGSISDLAYAVPNLTLGIANAAGAANSVIRSDATILVFDAVVPSTIQPDDAAAVGVATVVARRDHEHGIVAAAPGANSVSVAASAEGAATSFSRSDHTHNLDESIVPTWTGIHTHQANIILDDGVGDSPSIQWIGGSNDDTISMFLDDDAVAGDSDIIIQLADAAGDSALEVRDSGASAVFRATSAGDIYVGDRIYHLGDPNTFIDFTTDGMQIDAGGIEFIGITEAAADTLVINEGGVDIDTRIEASGAANAFFVQGSDGFIGIGTNAPGNPVHILTNANSSQIARIENTNAGASARAVFVVESDSCTGSFIALSAAATTAHRQDTISLAAESDAVALEIMSVASGSEIRFFCEGTGAANEIIVIQDDRLLLVDSSLNNGAATIESIDVAFSVAEIEAAAGGARIRGLKEAASTFPVAVWLQGYLNENANTTKTTAARSIVEINSFQTAAGAITNTVANGNVWGVRTYRGGTSVTVAFIDEDGDFYYDGALNNYDAYNDAIMAFDLSHVLAQEWEKVLMYNADALESAGIIGPPDMNGNRMVSNKRLNMLLMGAVGQLNQRLNIIEQS